MNGGIGRHARLGVKRGYQTKVITEGSSAGFGDWYKEFEAGERVDQSVGGKCKYLKYLGKSEPSWWDRAKRCCFERLKFWNVVGKKTPSHWMAIFKYIFRFKRKLELYLSQS